MTKPIKRPTKKTAKPRSLKRRVGASGSLPLSEYQWRLARLIAKANNGVASTTELGCWTGKGRLAVYSAMSSLEKKGYACQFRVGHDQWAALTWSLRGELKRHIARVSEPPHNE